MARIEITDDTGIRGILIDGYFPDFSYFQDLNRDGGIYEKLPDDPEFQYTFKKTYGKYLKPGRQLPSERVQFNGIKKMVEGFTEKYCNHKLEPFVQKIFPARHNIRFDRTVTWRGKQYGDYSAIQSLSQKVKKEILKAELDGYDNYFFNVALLEKNDGRNHQLFENCLKNWMDIMNFRIREENEYINFDKYREAAEIFLIEYIGVGDYHCWFHTLEE